MNNLHIINKITKHYQNRNLIPELERNLLNFAVWTHIFPGAPSRAESRPPSSTPGNTPGNCSIHSFIASFIHLISPQRNTTQSKVGSRLRDSR